MQAVGHDRARGAAAPGADRDALAFGVVDEVLHDQKVIDKAHAADDVELVVKLRAHLLASGEALGKALVAELPEIGIAVALARGQVEARQVVVAEFKVELTARGDFDGVFHGLGQRGEERAHFVLALEVELLRLKAQAVCLVHGVAGLDAQQHVLRRGILFFEIVRVVRHGEGDAGLAAQADQAVGGRVLLGDAVVLDLEIEVLLAEERAQVERARPRSLEVAADDRLRDLAGQTAREADQPLGVLVQQLPVDARLDIKALGEARGHEIAEIAVALFIPTQQNEVGIFVVGAVLLAVAAARRDIDLAADDGLDTRGLAGLIEGHRAVHDAVVGDGQRLLPELGSAFGHAVDPARAVEQGVFTVDMKVYKCHMYYTTFFSIYPTLVCFSSVCITLNNICIILFLLARCPADASTQLSHLEA